MQTLTLQKWGNSQGVRLSKTLIQQAGLHVGQSLDVKVRDGSVTLTASGTNAMRLPDIDALFAAWGGSFTPCEDGFAAPVGREAL